MRTRRTTKKEIKQWSAWEKEGEDAARAGLGKDTCPRLYHIMYRACWFVGWERGGGNMTTGKVKL